MDYEEIYSRSYMKKYDPQFFQDKSMAYELMNEWMHEIAAMPHVRQAFSQLELDDDAETLTYKLTHSIDEASDDNFVIKLFTDGFVICWMRPKVDSVINVATVIGGKEEKRLISNYSVNIQRLEQLEKKLKKYIRDYGYFNGKYGSEG